MTNINGSTIPVSLVYDARFKKAVNTSYSGIQIPANVYNKGLFYRNKRESGGRAYVGIMF